MPDEKKQRLDSGEDDSSATMPLNATLEQSLTPVVPINTLPLTDKMKGWKERVNESAAWETYYKSQNICVDDEELELMKQTFQTPLPVAIRVNASAAVHCSALGFCRDLSGLDSSRPNKCSKLSWSTDGNAWQWNDISRTHVRKDPALIQLKKWFVDHENIGTLTRQEAVSMIPPLVLDPRPGDVVLDMCAAPGSKTCQMIESIRGEGVVVASDVEWKRANMLSHQVQRLSSPANIVCNQDATMFPTIAAFDRVLCDVPCTGDGTIRKSPDIWRRWQISDGNALHVRQLQILVRGINLVKPGGTLVYSTCSLNPIENEAVVAAALAQFKGTVELEPLPDLPGLIYRKGLTSWKVFNDRTKEEIRTVEELKELESQSKAGKLRLSMFPPADAEVIEQLEQTARFLPHLMNTGGFYVAKFVKKPTAESIRIAKGDGQPHSEVIPVPEDLYENLASFYGLDRSRVPINQLFFRDPQKKHIYYVSKEASDLLRTIPSSFKLVSMGVRAFADVGNWESPCPYRITQEGAEALKDLVSNRIASMPSSAFVDFLRERILKTEEIPSFVDLPKGGGIVRMQENPAVVMAVMISPQSVYVYADKLVMGYLLNILSGVHDPTI
jgi:16S rRNA C967 or C1407 C5-methylase (RsmB/RsmF family)